MFGPRHVSAVQYQLGALHRFMGDDRDYSWGNLISWAKEILALTELLICPCTVNVFQLEKNTYLILCYTVKKVSDIPPLGGNNLIFPAQGEFGK